MASSPEPVEVPTTVNVLELPAVTTPEVVAKRPPTDSRDRRGSSGPCLLRRRSDLKQGHKFGKFKQVLKTARPSRPTVPRIDEMALAAAVHSQPWRKVPMSSLEQKPLPPLLQRELEEYRALRNAESPETAREVQSRPLLQVSDGAKTARQPDLHEELLQLNVEPHVCRQLPFDHPVLDRTSYSRVRMTRKASLATRQIPQLENSYQSCNSRHWPQPPELVLPSTPPMGASPTHSDTDTSDDEFDFEAIVKNDGPESTNREAVGGGLGQAEFADALNAIIARAAKRVGATPKECPPSLSRRIFKLLDLDCSDSIEWCEFCSVLSMITNGTLQDRLRVAFRSYDLNGDGVLDEYELRTLLRRLLPEGQRSRLTKILENLLMDMTGDHPKRRRCLSWEEFSVASQHLEPLFQQLRDSVEDCLRRSSVVHSKKIRIVSEIETGSPRSPKIQAKDKEAMIRTNSCRGRIFRKKRAAPVQAVVEAIEPTWQEMSGFDKVTNEDVYEVFRENVSVSIEGYNIPPPEPTRASDKDPVAGQWFAPGSDAQGPSKPDSPRSEWFAPGSDAQGPSKLESSKDEWFAPGSDAQGPSKMKSSKHSPAMQLSAPTRTFSLIEEIAAIREAAVVSPDETLFGGACARQSFLKKLTQFQFAPPLQREVPDYLFDVKTQIIKSRQSSSLGSHKVLSRINSGITLGSNKGLSRINSVVTQTEETMSADDAQLSRPVCRSRTGRRDYIRRCKDLEVLPLPCVSSHRGIEHLNFADYGLGNKLAQAISASVTASLTSNQIRVIDLSGNRMCDDGAQPLLESLKMCTAVESINLSRNHLSVRNATLLNELINQSTSLMTLRLQGSRLGNSGVTALLLPWRNQVLQTLDLSNNEIGLQGGDAIGNALMLSKGITSLDLTENLIRHDAIDSIVQALTVNKVLQHLGLKSNGVGNQGCAAFAEMLEENTTLTSLDLGSNQIHADGAKLLAAALGINRTLQNLNLDRNAIGVAGFQALWLSISAEINAYSKQRQEKAVGLHRRFQEEIANFKVCSCRISVEGCDLQVNSSSMDYINPDNPHGRHQFELSEPDQRAAAQQLLQLTSLHPRYELCNPKHEGKPFVISTDHPDMLRLPTEGSWVGEIQEIPSTLSASDTIHLKGETESELARLLSENMQQRLHVLETAIRGCTFNSKFLDQVVQQFDLGKPRVDAVGMLLPCCVDWQRAHLWAEQILGANPYIGYPKLKELHKQSWTFCQGNPGGHYTLDLSGHIGKTLFERLRDLSAGQRDRWMQTGLGDRSELGDGQAFANLTLNGEPFCLPKRNMPLPADGFLDFDFVAPNWTRDQDLPMHSNRFEWFKDQLSMTDAEDAAWIRYLQFAEHCKMTCHQAVEILDLSPHHLRVAVAVTLWPHLCDLENISAVKKAAMGEYETPGSTQLDARMGLLNTFDAFHPDGSYEIHLEKASHRKFAVLLLQLSEVEGTSVLTQQRFQGVPFSAPTSWIKETPSSGLWKVTYESPEVNDKISEGRASFFRRHTGRTIGSTRDPSKEGPSFGWERCRLLWKERRARVKSLVLSMIGADLVDSVKVQMVRDKVAKRTAASP